MPLRTGGERCEERREERETEKPKYLRPERMDGKMGMSDDTKKREEVGKRQQDLYCK